MEGGLGNQDEISYWLPKEKAF